MTERIQNLCKRLSRFTLEEIALISELDESEIAPVLQNLVNENLLTVHDNNYIYNNAAKNLNVRNRRSLIFEYHSPETSDMVIKCFCANLSPTKTSLILSISEDSVCEFNKLFRKCIYNIQKIKLIDLFKNAPKMFRMRKFFNKNFYFYYYNDILYVSDEPLTAKNSEPFSDIEIKKFKIMYSMLCRRLNHNTFRYYAHLHLAEHIWRYGKNFSQLEKELKFLLFN